MAQSPDVTGVAAGAWAPNDWDIPVVASKSVFFPFGIEERSLIFRILTGSASGNIISAARARNRAEYRGEGKILITPYSSLLFTIV